MNLEKIGWLYWIGLITLLVTVSSKPTWAHDARNKNNQTGFLVLTADRGFVGNEEIREAFYIFAEGRNASLVFITDERTEKYLKRGLDTLLNKGAERIVAIPLFISTAAPRFQLVRELLMNEELDAPVSYAHAYGDSYFAVEDLADKFRTIRHPKDTAVLIVGYGAMDNDSNQKMQADWKRIAEQAAEGFDFLSVQTLIAYEKESGDEAQRTAQLKQAFANFQDTRTRTKDESKYLVMPFHFGPKLDSMMSFDRRLQQLLPDDIQWFSDENLDDKNLTIWLQREANRSQPFAAEDVGVVFLAHGADFNWNEAMRETVRPLMNDYKIEFAFSMADQATIQRAISKLEQRGAQAAIIVRAFAMEESFRTPIERMTGLDIDEAQHAVKDAVYTGHGDMHHGVKTNPLPRIRSILPIRTVGGLGANPLFAAAMYDRAHALSRNPAHETVILVAHGAQNDHQNKQWKKKLETVADHMRRIEGNKFQAIQVATWREDWPDKHAPWVKKVRTMIEEIKQKGGKAIVIPARITGQGREKDFLSGLDYELGTGFAPHPLFTHWVEEQIKLGIAQLNRKFQESLKNP